MPSFLTPYLMWIKLAGVVLLMAGAGYVGYRIELGAYNGLVAADAKAMTVAVQNAAVKQKKIDDGNQADAVAEAHFQGTLDAQIINLVLGAPANVTITQDKEAASADRAGCITFGFVRMLVAGERVVPADSLDYPSGESADTCTALEPSALASALAQDLAAGAGNGHQLDALIAAVHRNDGIVTAPPH